MVRSTTRQGFEDVGLRRRFRLVHAVGRGGFGTVYRAELHGAEGFSKTVALKILNSDTARCAEMACRLRDEARILGAIRHRAIVNSDGIVRVGGRWAVVMEYVDGVNLARLLREGPVPWPVALEIIAEVVAALDVVQEARGPGGAPLNLVHRDLKPSNLQLTAAGEVKILDFGVARADAIPRESDSGAIEFGSCPYLAPERLDGVDTAAGDVYALGAVLFEMLTGRPLGRAFGNPVRHQRRVSEALDGLSGLFTERGLGVIPLVCSMLAYDPRVRPTAGQVLRICEELRIQAPRPGLREWAARRVAPLVGVEDYLPDPLEGAVLDTEESTLPAVPERRLARVWDRLGVSSRGSTSAILRFQRRRNAVMVSGAFAIGALAAYVSVLATSFLLR